MVFNLQFPFGMVVVQYVICAYYSFTVIIIITSAVPVLMKYFCDLTNGVES